MADKRRLRYEQMVKNTAKSMSWDLLSDFIVFEK